MKRSRSEKARWGPAAAALRNRNIHRDYRQTGRQTSASEIIANAVEMQNSYTPAKAGTGKTVIRSREELAVYRQRYRSEMDEKIKRGYKFLGNFLKYARWEGEQGDFIRMRSVMEKAIQFHSEDHKLWRDYGELEASYGFVKEAREVFHRGVTRLPHNMDLWLKCLLLEHAAGNTDRVRDIFNRWVGLSPNCPHYAYELYILFEISSGGTREAGQVRQVLKKYVEQFDTPNSWLLYSLTESDVLEDKERAARVLETALQALPESQLWSLAEHRVPLYLSRLYASSDRVEEAKKTYQQLLNQLGTQLSSSNEAAADQLQSKDQFARTLSEFCQFVRNCKGETREEAEQLTLLQSQQLYDTQLSRDPTDLDARLSLYLLLRDKKRTEAMACLQPVTTFSLEEDPSRAQRIVVLRIEYARQLEADGDVQAARAVYTEALRTFPFEEAQCPKLWEEAAALEERHGDLSQARQILQNAVRISKDAKLVDALLRLESVAERRGAYASHGDYVNRLREVYKEVLKVHTLVVEYWLRFAKLEEDEGQVARAQALLSMCAQSFSSEATRLFKVSISRRYDMLEDVDRVWARRVGLQRRCIKRAEAEGTLQEEEPKMDKLLYDLLESVWSDYRYEALHWRTAVLMETTEVPSDLGTTLSRALARWSEAVEGVHQYYASLNKEDSTHVGRLRSTFKTLIERERILLKQSVGLEEGKNSFDEAQVLQQWVKLLLSPLVGEWGRLEVLYGDAKSLEEVKSVASQSTGKKRTRLFKNRA